MDPGRFNELKHPFVYGDDGDLLTVFMAERGRRYECEGCEQEVYLRAGLEDGEIRRHFALPPDSSAGGGGGGSCESGVESPEHVFAKQAMGEKLQEWFGGGIEENDDRDCIERRTYVHNEHGSDVPIPYSDRMYVQADVRCTFDPDSNLRGIEGYGKGLAVEIQHKNEGKDIEATEAYNQAAGYSTIWLDAIEDFSELEGASGWVEPEFDREGLLSRAVRVWPHVVPESDRWESPTVDLRCLEQRCERAMGETLPPIRPEGVRHNSLWSEASPTVRRRMFFSSVFFPGSEGPLDYDRTERFPLPDVRQRVSLPEEWYEKQDEELRAEMYRRFRDSWGDLFSGYETDSDPQVPVCEPTAPETTARLCLDPEHDSEDKWLADRLRKLQERMIERYRSTEWGDLFSGYEIDADPQNPVCEPTVPDVAPRLRFSRDEWREIVDGWAIENFREVEWSSLFPGVEYEYEREGREPQGRDQPLRTELPASLFWSAGTIRFDIDPADDPMVDVRHSDTVRERIERGVRTAGEKYETDIGDLPLFSVEYNIDKDELELTPEGSVSIRCGGKSATLSGVFTDSRGNTRVDSTAGFGLFDVREERRKRERGTA